MKSMSRSNPILAAVLAGAAFVAGGAASAQEAYPSKPIKILVGFGAGGSGDTIARLYGKHMADVLGTAVVVENRPGARQLLAINAALEAPADGYTLFAGTKSSMIQNPALRQDIRYDPLADFSMIGLAVNFPGLLYITPGLEIDSFEGLIDYATAHPGELNFGSAGVGSADHLAGAALQSLTGIALTHIPYKADVEVIREIVAGNVDVAFSPSPNVLSFVRSGDVVPLAVTSEERLPTLPDVPTLAELEIEGLSDLGAHTFLGFFGGADMPEEIVSTLNAAVNEVSQMPDVAEIVRETHGAEPAVMTPDELREMIAGGIEQWRAIGETIELPQ